MTRYELGIVDTRNLVNSIETLFDLELKNFALTSLKRRIERIIDLYKLNDVEGLLNRLKTDKEFYQQFLFDLPVKGTEMFRDPSLWRIVIENYIPLIKESSGGFKVLFAGNEFGEDLYSFAILLKEEGLLDKVRLFATVYCEKVKEEILKGEFDQKLIETNVANYNRLNATGNFNDYYELKNSKAVLDSNLLKDVTFLVQNKLFDNYPKGVKFVFFRNQMIYYNQVLADKVIKLISESLVPGGHLFLGSKEDIEYTNRKNDFILVDKSENIYKRKI